VSSESETNGGGALTGGAAFSAFARLPHTGNETVLDAISQTTGVPAEFDGYPAGTRAAQVPCLPGPRRRGPCRHQGPDPPVSLEQLSAAPPLNVVRGQREPPWHIANTDAPELLAVQHRALRRHVLEQDPAVRPPPHEVVP